MEEKKYQVLETRRVFPGHPDCPAAVEQSQLLYDREEVRLFLRVDMRNMGSEPLAAVWLDVCCFDENMEILALLPRIAYQKLCVKPGDFFGTDQMIPVPSMRTRRVTITCRQAAYVSGSTWRAAEEKEEGKEEGDGKTYEIQGSGKSAEKEQRVQAAWESNKHADDMERYEEQRKGPHKLANKQQQTPCRELEHEPQQKEKNQKKWLKVLAGGVLVLCLAVGGWGIGRYVRIRDAAYAHAMEIYDAGEDFQKAIEALAALDDYRFSGEAAKEIRWCRAMAYIQLGEYGKAVQYFWGMEEYKDSAVNLREIADAYQGIIAAGAAHTVALCKDGSVLATGDNQYGQCNVEQWQDMTAVAAGYHHTLGLRRDGMVEAVGEDDASQCAVGAWKNIIDVAAGEKHSVGLRNVGRVVAQGDNQYGQCDVTGWSGMVAVAAGSKHTVGLNYDGTVKAVGDDSQGACQVEEWEDIVAIAAGDGFTVGLKRDGSVLVAGNNLYGQGNTQGWDGMVVPAAGSGITLAVNYMGRVKAVGDNDWQQGNVTLWKNIVSTAGGLHHSVGVCRDGTVVAAGDNKSGQCQVSEWENVGIPSGVIRIGAY